MANSKCQLRIETDANWETDCDGCGGTIPPGTPYITDIDSCCGGGCCRCLCLPCVRHAMTLINALDAVDVPYQPASADSFDSHHNVALTGAISDEE